ncbi:type II secretion system protein [bacterium]|nr:type II secretion system protein [bacterium]
MKKSGFTLAEVLITLGIIGVVAAMTIPNLIANTNGAKFRSQFKKSISTLNQAGLMSQAQYDFDYAGTSTACGTDPAADHPESTMTMCAILNGTLTGQTYVGTVAALKRNANGSSVAYELKRNITIDTGYKAFHAYTLADGSIVAFNAGAGACELPIGTQLTGTVIGRAATANAAGLSNCTGFIDVNGVTLPNKEVACGTGATNTATKNVQTPCTVKNDANHMTDVFPIVFHDATVEPASDAAKYVLTSSK